MYVRSMIADHRPDDKGISRFWVIWSQKPPVGGVIGAKKSRRKSCRDPNIHLVIGFSAQFTHARSVSRRV